MYRVWAMMAAALMGFYGIVAWLGFRADLGAAKTHIASAFFLVVAVLFVHSLCIRYGGGLCRARAPTSNEEYRRRDKVND